MAAHRMVLVVFADEAAADTAVASLVAWEKAQDVVSRPVGVLVADENGHIKEHKLGKRSGRKGAGIGLLLAAVAPPTLLVGVVAGGVLGHFHHEGLGLTDADRDRIAAQLAEGKAAVGALVEDEAEAAMVSQKLMQLGGTPKVYEVTEEALGAVAAAVSAESVDASAATEASTVTD